MPISVHLFKPVAIAGLSGGGLSVGGYGIYYAYDLNNPTAHSLLENRGFQYSVPEPKLGVRGITNYTSSVSLKTYGCFKNFFPEVGIKNDTPSNAKNTVNEDPLKSASNILSSSDLGSQQPIGCALMDYRVKYDDTKTLEHFKSQGVFRSEVTFKNDQWGGALWAVGSNFGDYSHMDMTYYLVFLKKESNSGSIIGGYKWSDHNFSWTGIKPKIFSPEGEEGTDSIGNGSIKDKREEYREGGGVGYADEKENSSEVLQGIKIRALSSPSAPAEPEILGIGTKSGTFEEVKFKDKDSLGSELGYNEVSVFYSVQNGWVKHKTTSYKVDIKDKLNNFYSPFKGKKGRWEEINRYCRSPLFGTRNVETSDLNRLQSFCYTSKKP